MNPRVKIIRTENTLPKEGKSVIYVMSRDQRVEDNHALLLAQEEAEFNKIPLIVVFNLYSKVPNRLKQQYRFMFEGLEEVSNKLKHLNIPFYIFKGKPLDNLKQVEEIFDPTSIYFDFSPLRGPIKLKETFAKISSSNLFVVDTHNVIPVWVTSDKEEFAAYTIRPKINKLKDQFLVEPTKINHQDENFIAQNIDGALLYPNHNNFEELLQTIGAKNPTDYIINFIGGEKAAIHTLRIFIHQKLENYGEKRNNPTEEFQSELSPYLHFGQISSLRIILEIKKFLQENPENKKLHESAESFIEEILVRKELSDNFCYYNKNYDNFEGLKPWAKSSLKKHQSDKREYIYTLEELENAQTFDLAWNAAQLQMKHTGKMHGYMRMYWAKKVLEWSENAETAIQNLIYLNDKYHLDGYDPNGYVGILWSVGGLHDRPWFERPILGQIRYMNFNGLKNKFDVEKYISMWNKGGGVVREGN